MANPLTQMGASGRVVIPAAVRREVGLKPGDELIVRVDGGRIELETRENLLRRIRARWKASGKGGGMVDELLADRRRETAKEQRELEQWEKSRSSTRRR